MMLKKRRSSKLTLTHQDKIYFPHSRITKGDILRYYLQIAPYLLPYTRNRPLTMHRFPDGIRGESFYQKLGQKRFLKKQISHTTTTLYATVDERSHILSIKAA